MEHCNQSKLAENARAGLPGKRIPAGGGHSAQAASRWSIRLAAVLIVAAATAAYSNSLRCPLVFDDISDIANNISIRHLWPIWDVFVVQGADRAALHGRPVANLSLAFNYATGGGEPLHYHLTNLLVHVLAGLTLFGIVRRTLLLPSLGERFAAAATPLALAVALIWTVHPLNTAAVTYVVQRYESMMGLFYLLALYAALRCGTSAHPRRWAAAAVTATLLALGCKEVAVSIPVSILLYDRAFLAGSFREALRRRWGMYTGLAAAWAAFAVLFVCSYDRGGWAGYGLRVSWMEYARSQFGVILHYLRLSFWPCPLVLDYGWPVAQTVGEILPQAVAIGSLAAATAYALIRWPKWGFAGAWFFLVLAPTSSILPIRDLAFEHRMYLPLAAVVAGVVLGGYLAGQWVADRQRISRPALQIVSVSLLILAGVVLGILTFERNMDYQSELSIWEDTVAKAPSNGQGYNALGNALAKDGRIDEAIAHYEKALQVKPAYAEAHNNLGVALGKSGRFDEVIAHCNKALEINPNLADAHNNLGIALAGCGRFDEAVAHFDKALKIKPDDATARNNLSRARSQREEIVKALAGRRELVRSHPNDVALLNETAWTLATNPNASIRNGAEAVDLAQRAAQLSDGREPAILGTLAAAYAEAGRFSEAVQTAHKAVELAARQDNQPLAESINAKISLYEAGTPFREMPQPPAAGSTQP